MKISVEDLAGHESMTKRRIAEISEIKGKISIRATINIDTETGKITVSDEKGLIKFDFNNPKLAKQWADATK